VVSLRQGVYWIGDSVLESVHKHSLTSDAVLTSIDVGVEVHALSITRDGKALLLGGGNSAAPLTTVDTQTDVLVDASPLTSSTQAVCDDGTAIAANLGSGSPLTTFSINATAHLTQLEEVTFGQAFQVACARGGKFFVATSVTLRSFAARPLSATPVSVVQRSAVSIAINPFNSDVYLLTPIGTLFVYAFDSVTGSLGATPKASAATGQKFVNEPFRQIVFSSGKLFVALTDRLLTYDASLHLLSSEAIVNAPKRGICVSDGKTCFLLQNICWLLSQCFVLCDVVCRFKQGKSNNIYITHIHTHTHTHTHTYIHTYTHIHTQSN
jgi:hypothetical protein